MIRLNNLMLSSMVSIPGVFFSRYMPSASGDYVKIYLYLYSKLTASVAADEATSVSLLAETFQYTENDVIRALKYWEKEGLLSLVFEGSRLISVTFNPMEGIVSQAVPISASLPLEQSDSSQDSTRISTSPAVPQENNLPVFSPLSMEDAQEEESFRDLLIPVETYIGHPLDMPFIDRLSYLYLLFDKNSEIVEYLVSFCSELGHRKIEYIEKVALNCHKNQYRTLEDIRTVLKQYNPTVKAVMKSFGHTGRSAGSVELGWINKWIYEYRFSQDIIAFACDVTLGTIFQPSFKYADKILSRWKSQNIQTIGDARREVARFKKEAEEKANKENAAGNSQKARSTRGTKSNRFNTFEQREVDYDALGGIFHPSNPSGS